jgi:hypothetical protein
MENNPDALYPTGYQDCVIGFTDKMTYVLDAGLIIKKLMKRDKMTYEDASEFYNFNILGSYVGEDGPTYIYTNVED